MSDALDSPLVPPALREALRLSPSIVAIQSNLANALVLDGQIEEACELYADLARRFPQSPAFLCNWGVTLYRTGRHNEAIAAFQRALEINPDLVDARENLRFATEAVNKKTDQ